MLKPFGPRISGAVFALITVFSLPGQAQQSVLATDGAFATENAILDTSILFSIGAREARQELRGAFGWPTYQEGLVEGVYFRFDPDGYARFAPTPRLDTDVFEVICRPRTHVCLGRKDALLVTLNARGQVELQVENLGASDTFAVADGINELPLPASILQQLDSRMEILLSSGGELVVRRADEEVERISLKGFAAVTTYLRWVAAQQDYQVLPRGWPVPNSGRVAQTPGLTQIQRWQSATLQPGNRNIAIPRSTAFDPTVNVRQASAGHVSEVKDELKSLRNLLEKREQIDPPHKQTAYDTELAQLHVMIENLARQVQALQPTHGETAGQPQAQPDKRIRPVGSDSQPGTSFAERLDYLMTEIGLEPEVALMLLQQGTVSDTTENDPTDFVQTLVRDIRAELPEIAAKPAAKPAVSAQEYQVLTEYFRSVLAEGGLRPAGD